MVVQSYSKQLNTKTDKLSSQVNTNFDILEEASRKARNLEENETWQDTERKLRDFLHYYLNITNIHIERAHLVSRKEKAVRKPPTTNQELKYQNFCVIRIRRAFWGELQPWKTQMFMFRAWCSWDFSTWNSVNTCNTMETSGRTPQTRQVCNFKTWQITFMRFQVRTVRPEYFLIYNLIFS